MRWTRTRYFTLGVVLLLLGLQLRAVQSYVLNEDATRALHRAAKNSQIVQPDQMTNAYMAVAPSPKKTITPPAWIGWAFLTVGGVISLHALILPKEG